MFVDVRVCGVKCDHAVAMMLNMGIIVDVDHTTRNPWSVKGVLSV